MKRILPAEWHSQEAIILSWPTNIETWPIQLLEVQQAYHKFIGEIVDHQDLWLLVDNSQQELEVRRQLALSCVPCDRIRFFHIPTFDSWVRDYGPISVFENGQRHFTDWIFNGWGGKYFEEYQNDSLVPSRLGKQTNQSYTSLPFILEGGSIESDGRGTLMTTENCLLNANRNSQYTKQDIEENLKQQFGIKKFIWLRCEVKGDDTDGHIDDIARFVSDDTIVLGLESDSSDDNFEGTQLVLKQLQQETNSEGRPFKVVTLPMPKPVYFDGERLPASYANFLITNKKILVPTFRCSQDNEAIAVLSELFPTRKVVGIDAVDIIFGLGSLHCLSMQVPDKSL